MEFRNTSYAVMQLIDRKREIDLGINRQMSFFAKKIFRKGLIT